MTVDKITNPPSIEKVVDKVNEVIDNLGGGSGSGANTDLSNLTATGEAHFQEPLVSGTNIKTINNTSLLGSGDISVGSYSAGTGLSLSGTAFNHSNSVTAGTIGTSSATSGSTISIPYATYDAQGHITGKGTHTHTVTGFLTSSSSEVASTRFDGAWVFPSTTQLATDKTATTSDATSNLKNIMGSAGTDSYSYLLLLYIYGNYKSSASQFFVQSTPMGEQVVAGVGSAATVTRQLFPFIVGSNKLLKVRRSAALDAFQFSVYAYRRIGTNS